MYHPHISFLFHLVHCPISYCFILLLCISAAINNHPPSPRGWMSNYYSVISKTLLSFAVNSCKSNLILYFQLPFIHVWLDNLCFNFFLHIFLFLFYVYFRNLKVSNGKQIIEDHSTIFCIFIGARP